jgi:PEGA domain
MMGFAVFGGQDPHRLFGYSGLYQRLQPAYASAFGTERVMVRVGFVVAATAAVMGVALAGCSGMPDWMPSMPDWMSSSSSTPQLQTLRFESDPPGADIRTIQGQTCFTPCALAVSAENQPITITKAGYVAQTIQVTVAPPPEHSFWENPPPALTPNPVQVVLQAMAPPPKPAHKPLPRRTSERTRTAAKVTQPPAEGGGPFPAPPMQQQQPAPGGFPPVPASQQ